MTLTAETLIQAMGGTKPVRRQLLRNREAYQRWLILKQTTPEERAEAKIMIDLIDDTIREIDS